jgi:outer membrane immunogenic protein
MNAQASTHELHNFRDEVKMMKSASGLAAIMISTASVAAHADTVHWSGPYAGINAGYAQGSTTIDDYDCDLACSSLNLSPHGVAVGGTVGYNHQAGALVLGIEGDWDYANAKRTVAFDWASSQSYHIANIKSFATLRGRAGIAVEKALLYGTVGLGLIDQRTNGYNPDPDSGTNRYQFSDGSAHFGIAYGAGIEYKLTQRVSAKLEYLSIKTAVRASIPDTGSNCTGSDETYCAYGVKSEMDAVRVGINYAF